MLRFTSHESAGRLPENIRTAFEEYNQGTKFGPHRHLHGEHVAQSRLAIKRAADIALERVVPDTEPRALLLGTGPCVDIPVPYLARKFRLTMVDVHAGHTLEVVKRLPPELQDKIHVIEADLTGIVGRLDDEIKALGATSTYKVFQGQAAGVLKEMEEEAIDAPPNLGRGYQFVSSHGVGNILGANPMLVLDEYTLPRYGEVLKENPDNPTALENAARSLKWFIRGAHIRSLVRNIGDQGILHYADGYYPGETPGISGAVGEVLTHYFDPVGEMQTWPWQNKPDLELTVIRGTFTPKPEE